MRTRNIDLIVFEKFKFVKEMKDAFDICNALGGSSFDVERGLGSRSDSATCLVPALRGEKAHAGKEGDRVSRRNCPGVHPNARLKATLKYSACSKPTISAMRCNA